MAKFSTQYTKGYKSSSPKEYPPNGSVHDEYYCPPGEMAVAVKAKWKGIKEPYPYGENEEGGGGGGDA